MIVTQFKSSPKNFNILCSNIAMAIEGRDAEKTTYYIKNGLDSIKTYYNENPGKISEPHLACKFEFVDRIKKIILKIDKENTLNKDFFGECVLIAAKLNHEEIIREFIDCDLNSEIRSKDVLYPNFTAMDFARFHSNKQMEFNLIILGYPPISPEQIKCVKKSIQQSFRKLNHI